MKFSDSEIASLTRRGFTVSNNKEMAEITSGEIIVAVLSRRRDDSLFQLTIKLPDGSDIFCKASPIETLG
jgi:hypothetical protein